MEIHVNAKPQKAVYDPLAYLPCSTILSHCKGQIIYGPQNPSGRVILILSGKVKVCRLMENGRRVVVDIYRADEFFGESTLVGMPHPSEIAISMENVKTMSWTVAELEEISMSTPQLAIAMMQMVVQRSVDFMHRIESFALDSGTRRLSQTLALFADRFGTPEENGSSVRIMALTHQLLAEYVGTSREVITQCLNEFRRQGHLSYSRYSMSLRNETLNEWRERGGSRHPTCCRYGVAPACLPGAPWPMSA